jgi:hypothetical protein
LFFAAALAVGTLPVSLGRRDARAPLVFALSAAAAGAPWYVYSAVHVGNPVFPFLAEIFGHGSWAAGDLEGQLSEMRQLGMGRSLRALVLLPWNLLAHPDRFGPSQRLSPLLLALLPGIAIVGATRRFRGLLALAAAYGLVWFFSVQSTRYLLPVVPFGALLAGVALDRLVRWLAPRRRTATAAVATVAVAAVLLFPGWLFAVRRVVPVGPPPGTAEERHAYLARQLPSYPAYRWLNETKGSAYRLYAIYDENMAYFADGVFMGDWFGPARYRDVVDKLADGPALHEALSRLGADHLLVPVGRYGARVPEDLFSGERFRLVHRTGAILLLELLPR